MRRAWLLPLSSAFCIGSLAILAGIVAGPGCQTRCFNAFDCGPGSFCAPDGRCETECFTDRECREPIECRDNPAGCRPKGLTCNSQGRCTGDFRFAVPDDGQPIPVQQVPPESDGWNAVPGEGAAFIVDSFSVAQEDRGFDIDGRCDEESCIDNFLWRLGDLGNDQIQAGLRSGESLLLVEIAGIDEPFRGRDDSVTVKIYAARDADDPFFPLNNFQVPDGQSTCCEFSVNPRSLIDLGRRARAQAPARIERGRLRSLTPVPIEFTITVGVPPHPEIKLERVTLAGRVASDLTRINDGLLGGVIPVNALAQTDNPYCKTIGPRCDVEFGQSTLIDLVSTILGARPDIDLDGDGNECVKDTDGDSVVDICCNGNPLGGDSCPNIENICPGGEVLPLTEGRPAWQCALNPEIADGYSVAFTFTAVKARIVGR